MTKFSYKEIDSEGREALDVIAQAYRFNEWMYSTIKPFCTGKILEVGSGIGNLSKFFIDAQADITLSDIRGNYCQVLKQQFASSSDVIQLDLEHPDFDNKYGRYLQAFDTVFALNVVEHIKDHVLAIRNCNKLLKPCGNAVILVPAYNLLYNRFDQELGHFRRYTSDNLNALLRKNDFEIIHYQYFNFVGIWAWVFSGKLQRNKTIPKAQMSLYDKFVPLFKVVDKIVFNKSGLSVISVGRKK